MQNQENSNQQQGLDLSDINALANVINKIRKPAATDAIEGEELAALQAQMYQNLAQTFEKNLNYFKANDQYIYDKFQNYQVKRSFEFFCTGNGNPNIFYNDTQTFFYPCIDPKELCMVQCQSTIGKSLVNFDYHNNVKDEIGQLHSRYINHLLDIAREGIGNRNTCTVGDNAPLVLFFGFGLGYHVETFSKLVNTLNYIFIEPNPDLFYAALHTFDFASFIEEQKSLHHEVFFVVDESPYDTFYRVSGHLDRHGIFLASYKWAYTHYHSPEIFACTEAVIKDISNNSNALGFMDDNLYGISHTVNHALHKIPFFSCYKCGLSPEIGYTPVFIL